MQKKRIMKFDIKTKEKLILENLCKHLERQLSQNCTILCIFLV